VTALDPYTEGGRMEYRIAWKPLARVADL
jgi:hypothetical protein